MAGSLQTTIETLGRSRNDAATGTLLAALPTASGAIVDQIIRALVRRTSKQGHVAVLARWPQMGAELRSAVLANQGRMGGALREALLSDNDQMFANACDVARESGEYDLAPTLITVAEQPSGQRREAATTLVVGLAERLLRPFDEEEVAGFSRHPETIRQGVLESLQRSVERFAAHGNRALVEAFVILAGPDNPSLRTILQAPRHTCHETIVDILEESQNPEVLKLLTAFLIGAEAPPAVRSIVARRTDDPFVATLLELPLSPASMALEKNLACIHGLACLASAAAICQRCSPEKQAAAMRLMSYSGAAEEAKLEFAATLLSRGAPQARLAACECLALIAGQRANELILAALDDPEGEVQAAATRQLRQRHIPGTLARLIELASSPHAAVQAAARDSLTEFSFENFLARYETLDDDARRQTASLVALVDVTAPLRLRGEMDSPVRRRRMRAIEIAELMGITSQLADVLVELLDDDDHLVRAAAADALAHCTADDVRDALLAALQDRSHAVQVAAANSLRVLGQSERGAPSGQRSEALP